ncbi:MAG: BON domain-containing protein [Pseudomonadota bacterium]|nr:BON domain-containing protein [Pseudomonadota bacterium]
MNASPHFARFHLASVALFIVALAGCQKTTTTTQTPGGTVTTTTVSASPTASQALAKADAMGSKVADDVRDLGNRVQTNAGAELRAGAAKLDARAAEATARAGEKIDDAALTAKIKSALLVEPSVKSLDIKVETQDGVVTLSGVADSAANAALVARVARETNGVKSVRNNVVVKRAS